MRVRTMAGGFVMALALGCQVLVYAPAASAASVPGLQCQVTYLSAPYSGAYAIETLAQGQCGVLASKTGFTLKAWISNYDTGAVVSNFATVFQPNATSLASVMPTGSTCVHGARYEASAEMLWTDWGTGQARTAWKYAGPVTVC
jgi:hypothetical protein